MQIIISITINILLFIWHNALIYPGGFEQLEKDFEAAYKNASGGKKQKQKVLDIPGLMIPQGSVVGVVGNNGAGKTSFVNNLCGLFQTAKGCMSMDGKTYMAGQRMKICYMVMQDVNHQLFTESVLDEILLSLDNADEEKATLNNDIETAYLEKEIERMYDRLAKAGRDTSVVSYKLSRLKNRKRKL